MWSFRFWFLCRFLSPKSHSRSLKLSLHIGGLFTVFRNPYPKLKGAAGHPGADTITPYGVTPHTHSSSALSASPVLSLLLTTGTMVWQCWRERIKVFNHGSSIFRCKSWKTVSRAWHHSAPTKTELHGRSLEELVMQIPSTAAPMTAWGK